MPKKSIAVALALGLPAFTLSTMPGTSAFGGCRWVGTAPSCGGKASDCGPGEQYLGDYASAPEHRRTPEGKATPFGSECFLGGFKVLCCTKPDPAPAPADHSRAKDWMKYKDKKAAPETPEPKGSPPPTKKLGKRQMACANNDVDVYDSPVEPRNVTGVMSSRAKAAILERHPDGWWKLEGYGWVAQDHLSKC